LLQLEEVESTGSSLLEFSTKAQPNNYTYQ